MASQPLVLLMPVLIAAVISIAIAYGLYVTKEKLAAGCGMSAGRPGKCPCTIDSQCGSNVCEGRKILNRRVFTDSGSCMHVPEKDEFDY